MDKFWTLPLSYAECVHKFGGHIAGGLRHTPLALASPTAGPRNDSASMLDHLRCWDTPPQGYCPPPPRPYRRTTRPSQCPISLVLLLCCFILSSLFIQCVTVTLIFSFPTFRHISAGLAVWYSSSSSSLESLSVVWPSPKSPSFIPDHMRMLISLIYALRAAWDSNNHKRIGSRFSNAFLESSLTLFTVLSDTHNEFQKNSK